MLFYVNKIGPDFRLQQAFACLPKDTSVSKFAAAGGELCRTLLCRGISLQCRRISLPYSQAPHPAVQLPLHPGCVLSRTRQMEPALNTEGSSEGINTAHHPLAGLDDVVRKSQHCTATAMTH